MNGWASIRPRPPRRGPNDLLVAVRAGDEAALVAALSERGGTAYRGRRPEALRRSGPPPPPQTVGSALRGGGTLALISVPGQYAFPEAMDAVRSGISVMLFSDNVPVEQEILLKDAAAGHGALVMGPDAGTAVVGGLGLGFANALRPGPVGMVAASGTGAQQVSCLLDAAGVGVTAILGVGGRDLSAAVAGRSTLAALELLDAHQGTELVVVLSKPPDPEVADRLRAAAAKLRTPALVAFVGRGQPDLTAVTQDVLAAVGAPPVRPAEWPAPYDRAPRAGLLRGFFSGGTLCDEAMVIAAERLGPIASNIPLEPDWAIGDDLRSPGHLMIDFGDDQLTRGRPHPMIDPSLRIERIAEAAADPACAVLLLDVVLGYGADQDPARSLAPAIAQARDRAAATAATWPWSCHSSARRVIRRAGTRWPGRWPPPEPACTCPTPPRPDCGGPRQGSRPVIELELDEPPVVVTAGTSLFADALRAQAAAPREVRWAPPPPGTEAGLAAIAADDRGRPRRRRVRPQDDRRPPALGGRCPGPPGPGPVATRAAARGPAGQLGRRVGAAARRTGRGHGVRGPGRRRGRGRPDRGQRRRVAGALPLARRGGPDGRGGERVDAGLGARGHLQRRPRLLHAQ